MCGKSVPAPLAPLVRLASLVLALALLAAPARALTFVVNNTGDGGDAAPGDGTCATSGAVCTLRAAIQEANARAGADVINFNIGGGGLQTISPAAAYPIIIETVTIDGTTQPLYAGTPIIEVNGAATPANTNGLTLSGAATTGSVIRGLIVDQFPGTGNAIRVLASCTNVVIAGNYIGTDPTGSLARPSAVGVFIQNATNNRVGGTVAADRNVVSGNSTDGIQIAGASATGNVVQGNYVGLDASGTVGLGNAAQGIVILNGASNNTVGGTAAGAGNVISGNGNYGVAVSGSSGNHVEGNRIGTDAAGTAAIGNKYGVALVVGATGNTIGGTASGAGNVISGNGIDGIVIDNSSSNTVEQNLIGTDVSGTAKVPNVQHGIQILNGASSNVIGGTVANTANVISGNGLNGVDILQAGTNGNHVSGNTIGLDVTGTVDLGNTAFGVAIAQAASGNVIGETGGGNVISGNDMAGVRIVDQNTNNNLVQLNYIGLDVTGTLPRPNSAQGVILESGAGAATGNTVGGAGLGNVISGNGSRGIEVRQLMTGTLIAGNLIGTDATGLAGIGNGSHGVYLAAGAAGNTVGGTTVAERNVISANAGQGVRIDGAGTGNNVVAGNFIGTDAAGTGALGNTSGGVATTNAAASNTIGGTAAGAGNVIAFNATYGVNVAAGAGTGNGILGNAIFGNVAELGIDLVHEPGVTSNDLGDVDTGANDVQNFPVLSAASTNTTDHIHIAGSLNSAASTTYRVEFFASTADDPSGFGEGERYLGAASVGTDVAGNAVIGVTLPAVVAAGEYVTATATDPSNNTSEFSAAILAVGSLVVTTTSDSTTGSDTSSVSNLIANPGSDGRISLREAILATNNTAGTDTIRFGIPLTDAGHEYYQDDSTAGSLTTVQGTALADSVSPSSVATPDFDPDYPAGLTRSWYRIRPTSALDTIAEGVVLDGTTQPGAIAGGPVLVLDGSLAGALVNGLELAAGPGTVRGLVVNRFGNDALNLRGPGGFTVTGNYLGTDASGTMAAGNVAGSGVFVTNLTGAPTTIGGSTPALRNVISANGLDGVYVYNYFPPVNTEQVRIQGNYIGTDVTGTVGLGTQTRGIVLEYTGGHLIGGSGAGEGNLISGNAGPGIDMNGNWDTGVGGGAPDDNNVIEGNWIGTNAAGTGAIPNAGPAIQMYGTVDANSSASGNTVRGNVLAASTGADAHGIAVWGNADDNVFDGNFIGTDAGGTIDLGNAGSGIHIESQGAFLPTGNTVQNNVIRFNDVDGVHVLGTGSSVTVTQNQIDSNDGLGINLGADSVTLNDDTDPDVGPNDLLNYPTFAPPLEGPAGTLTVNYALNVPAGYYRVEFFKNPVVGADPSGYGEGRAFASTVVVSHPTLGREQHSTTLSGNAGDVITATATLCTDGTLSCTAPAGTSEFSPAVLAVTTAVELMSFTATGGDAAVLLEWKTASELNNLGFLLYRSLSETGPWTRITPSLIAGLGSSPVGASYSWTDTGLTNGTRYFYRLEDIDAASRSTFHGPVSAVPQASSDGTGDGGTADDGSGDDGPGKDSEGRGSGKTGGAGGVETYGDPSGVALHVLSRTARQAVVELVTPGFYASRDAGDHVRVSIPGFDLPSDPHAPALPFRRVLLDALVGRQVRLATVDARDEVGFPGLVPAAVGYPEMQVEPDGTVRPARRPASLRAAATGLTSASAARISGVAFEGESKKAVLELAPLRYDAGRGQLVLCRRLVVTVVFEGRELSETGTGSRGRRTPRSRPGSGGTLAFLYTSQRGLHSVAFESLFPGRRRALAVGGLALERQGEGVPFHVEPATGIFGPGSRLYFYADRVASSTAYSGEIAFELVRQAGGGEMATASVAPTGSPLLSSSRGRSRFEVNRLYQSGLLEAEDPWLWDAVFGGQGRSFDFALSGLDPGAAGQLSLFLQGGSDAEEVVDHHLRISVNGSFVAETRFDGKSPYALQADVAAGVLREGANTLTVENVGDTGVQSLVFVDRFTVDFPQSATLRGGLFEGAWPDSGVATVAGASWPIALDVSDPGAPVWLTAYETGPSSVRLQAAAGHRYLLVSPEAVLSPRIAPPVVSSLLSETNQADYILIAPEELLSAAAPLLERRQAQGLTTRAVGLGEIASVFGHGDPSAEAIRSFLTYAFHSWAPPSPRYVLLLGDASSDPRNFTGTAEPAPLPALWTKTSYLWTASDPTLAAVNGDDALPDLAIGRLPATTLEQARALVAKVLDWEDSGQDLGGAAVLVADNPDPAGNFEADVDDIRSRFLAETSTTTIKLRELGTLTRPAILDAFDRGASLMSYVGHGGAAVWASENVLNSWDVDSLQAQTEQPLMLTMNCLNGYFVAPNFESLSEAFLKAEGRGTIAAISPSGLSVDGPAHVLHRALMGEITSGRHARLGDAFLAAQQDYADSGEMPELLAIYHLFGDPAMKIR
jgi:CSLREA domain-containing protein